MCRKDMEMKKIALICVIIFIASFSWASGQDKIVVAAKGKTAASEVSEVAARAPYFLIFDESGKFLGAVENPYMASKGGAGTAVVSFLAQKGATMVVAGEFGSNMTNALSSKGMRFLKFQGSAEEGLKRALREMNQ